ncbi:MAG TPA: recombinase family protein [Gaiellaceae bacterium]|nr:recombinase family protein [Gaiellaceae bacterium]
MRPPLLAALCCLALAGSARAAAPRTVYVSPTGSDAGPCTQAEPCAGFDRAYRAARPGDTVELAGGTYPPQTVGVDPTKVSATQDVLFRPAAGASVTIDGDLAMLGSHAIFRDLRLRFLYSQAVAGPQTSNHVVFQDLDGTAFLIGPNRAITIAGGDWGPNTGPGTEEDKIGPDGAIPNQWPTDIVLDGLTIHDQNSTDLSSEHMGGLFLISGGPITIENSHFLRNVVYDVQVQDFTSPDCCGMTFGAVHDVLLRNNVFEHPVTSLPEGAGDDRQPELQLDPRHGGCWSNWTIVHNTFENGLALGLDGAPCFQNVLVSGNLGPALGGQCFRGAAGLAWQGNLWLGGGCGAADATLPYGYVAAGAALVPTGVAAAAVRRVFGQAAAGSTLVRIARGLRRDLGRAWTVARVRQILSDPTYRGNRFGARGSQPALVDAKTWRASRRALR